MQLLPRTRNSATLEETLVEAEKWAHSNAEKLHSSITLGNTVYSYSGHGYIAAATHHWATATLLQKQSLLEEADTYTHYIQPYIEETGEIILYTTRRNDPALKRLSDASRWTGWRLVAVTPPLTPHYRELLRNTTIIETPETQFPEIYMELLALHTIKKQLEDTVPGNPRARRLIQHIEDGFMCTIDGLKEKYLGKAPRGCRELLVTSTRYLEPAAIYYAEKISETGIQATYHPAALLADKPRHKCITVISTGVDTDTHKRLRYTAAQAGARLIEITIDTDPLETYMYMILVTLLHAAELTGNHIL